MTLLQRILGIKNETEEDGNTTLRVGGVLEDMLVKELVIYVDGENRFEPDFEAYVTEFSEITIKRNTFFATPIIDQIGFTIDLQESIPFENYSCEILYKNIDTAIKPLILSGSNNNIINLPTDGDVFKYMIILKVY